MKRNASTLGFVCLVIFGLVLPANPDFGSGAASNIIGWLPVILGGLVMTACGMIHLIIRARADKLLQEGGGSKIVDADP